MQKQFNSAMNAGRFFDVAATNSIAIAVSGGPDSLALAGLLARWAVEFAPRLNLHALSVDHGLRAESAQEAAQVGTTLARFSNLDHTILRWEAQKPSSKIQEEARAARYDLLETYCASHGITHLFLGHHQADQAETFLFRLCKGSGLDGLAAMRPQQQRGALTLCRPLLTMDKEDLIAYCRAENLPFSEDPSNENERFARVRLRGILPLLAGEGLSIKRLAVTAQRMERAASALDIIAQERYQISVENIETSRIVFNIGALISQPDEIMFRILEKAMYALQAYEDYGPRTERIESIVTALTALRDQNRDQNHDQNQAPPWKDRTLGGIVFRLKNAALVLELEKP
ncbi:MAG: tRNA lysidine(34) synthetase TilS [Alphaproteobacteria bacterium]